MPWRRHRSRPRAGARSPSSATPTPARPPSPRSSCCTRARSARPDQCTPGPGGAVPRPTGWSSSRQRGISVTSTVLQFPYRDHVINLLDTPGHRDFSEDTYRVLAAVDAVVMVLDSAKGIEPQTLKLFEVCRARQLPVITFLNKFDRPGLDMLELLDQIEAQIDLRPTPVTWPVGHYGEFRGVIDRRSGIFTRFTRTTRGAAMAPEEDVADPSRPRPKRALRGRRRSTAPVSWMRSAPMSTLPRSSPAVRRRSSSAPRSRTSGSATSSTPWSISLRPRLHVRRSMAASVRSTRRALPSCSRCRRTWIGPIETASRSCASAPVGSSAA